MSCFVLGPWDLGMAWPSISLRGLASAAESFSCWVLLVAWRCLWRCRCAGWTQRAGKKWNHADHLWFSIIKTSSTVMIINCMGNHMVLWCAIYDSHSGAVITVSIYDYPLGDSSTWLSPTWLQVKTILSLRRVMAMMPSNNASIFFRKWCSRGWLHDNHVFLNNIYVLQVTSTSRFFGR